MFVYLTHPEEEDPMPLAPEPGSTLRRAYNVGIVDGQSRPLRDAIRLSDPNDYLRFTLRSSASRLSVRLSGLRANAQLEVIRDRNNNNRVDRGEILGRSVRPGSSAEQINLSNLPAGNRYFVRVYGDSGNTNYTLSLTSDLAGDTLARPRNIGTLPLTSTNTFSDFVGNIGTGVRDLSDFYRFNIDSQTTLTSSLVGVGAKATVQLLDSSGIVLQDAVDGSFNNSTPAKQITRTLNSGTYFLKVSRLGANSTNYTLNLTTTPPPPPPPPPLTYSLSWVNQFGSSSTFDQTTDVAVDSAGNVYVVGHSTGAFLGDNAGFYDGFLAKFNGQGILQWIQEIETSTNDFVNAVAVDSAGNIYIGGNGSLAAVNAGVAGDAFIARYDSSGNQSWIRRLQATTGLGGDARVNDLGVDTAGNLYVTGRTADGGSTNFDMFTGKYSAASGQTQWFNRFGTINSNAWDEGLGIAVDNTGAVYVSGRTEGALSSSNAGVFDSFLLKYDGSGNQQWIQQFGTTGEDFGNKVSTDSSGNVYVTGTTGGNLGGTGSGGGYLARFTSNGARSWTVQFGGTLPTDANDVKIDLAGNVYVAGRSQNGFGNTNLGTWDAYFLRFTNAGVLQKSTLVGTTSADEATALTLDSLGNIYLAGTTFGVLEGISEGGTDFFVARLNLVS